MNRPWIATVTPSALGPVDAPCGTGDALLKLMGSPDIASRRWVWEQYDHMVMADTIQRPGGDAAVVRVHGTPKGLAATTDVTPRYCKADPFEGGKQAVAEAYRNLCAVGAQPLAVTDNLNFGNPEKPEIMGQLVGCIKGIGEACRALDFPVVSGNVSLYNETEGSAILPTPAIGGVGLLADAEVMATIAFKSPGQPILLIGNAGAGHLGQSLYLRELCGREEGPAPTVDLEAERAAGEAIRVMISTGVVTAVHDLSDGGIGIGAAEMALAGDIGCTIRSPGGDEHAIFFGEDQGRYLVTVNGDMEPAMRIADSAGVAAVWIGETGGDDVMLGEESVPVADLRKAHEGWFPGFMGT